MFYKSREDLADILASYFEAGLKNNEFCICVASGPLNTDELREAMRERIAGFNGYLEKGRIEIIPHDEWYIKGDALDLDNVLKGWIEKLQQALDRGYSGLRASGNTYWLEKKTWNDFLEYEHNVNDTIGGHKMIALCTYPIDKCGVSEIMDVASTHPFAIIKHDRKWKLIENMEYKEARKAQLESEERFRAIFENAGVGIALCSLDGRFIRANHKFCDIVGYTPDELLHKMFGDITHKDDISAEKEYVDQLISDKISTFSMEKRYVRKDGFIVWVNVTVSLIREQDGTTKYAIGVIEDITERKQIELELESAKSQAELYLDLMGHDINNMNQVGLGFLELALDMLSLDENGRLIISKSMGALESSSRLIDNVRKLQKVRSGELSSQEVDVGQTLSGVCAYYSRVQDGTSVINYEPVTGYKVMANELLYDVFSNIIENAVKHSQGRPVVNVRMEKTNENDLTFYRITVEDNGRGVPDELKGRIFTRFRRGNTKAEGKGLGLYLVKTLVESYNGKVWVEDRVPGDHVKGSRFVVLLPAHIK